MQVNIFNNQVYLNNFINMLLLLLPPILHVVTVSVSSLQLSELSYIFSSVNIVVSQNSNEYSLQL